MRLNVQEEALLPASSPSGAGERGFLYSASYGFLSMHLHIRIQYLLAYHVFVHLCVLASWRESASSVELCVKRHLPVY